MYFGPVPTCLQYQGRTACESISLFMDTIYSIMSYFLPVFPGEQCFPSLLVAQDSA